MLGTPRSALVARLVATASLVAASGCSSPSSESPSTEQGGSGTGTSFEPRDACGAASGALAWSASIPSPSAGLGLVDVATGPTNDVVVAATAGPSAFALHRWTSAGAAAAAYTDTSSTYGGPMVTSGIFVDPGNDVFYGTLRAGSGATATPVELSFTRVSAAGSVVFTSAMKGSQPASDSAPEVGFLQVGGDATNNLHGILHMGSPAPIAAGVYCYLSDGTSLGGGAGSVVDVLTPTDFLWPSLDNDLVLWQAVSSTTNLACGATSAVPAAGAVALAKLDGSGSCLWSKLLALPTAAVKDQRFRLGADGSMLAAVVYAGTIDFGGGPLTSSGADALAVARFDGTGALLWARSFGGPGATFHAGSVGATASGDVLLTAGYEGSVDLGGGPLPASDDTFVAVFDTAGRYRWSRTVKVGATGKLLAAAGACGVAIATDSPTVDFGDGPLSTAENGVGVAALGL